MINSGNPLGSINQESAGTLCFTAYKRALSAVVVL
jgi:hypothetical protein